MPNKTNFRVCGLVAAPFTPFNQDGSLNLDVIDKYVKHLHNNQVLDVFICGTTGEGMSMSVDERMKVAEKWVQAGKDRLDKIIVQVGANNLVESQQLAAHAQKIGASAIAALPSVFFKPSTVDALVEYCRQIALSAPDLPFYYYHFPHLTDVRVDVKEFFLRAEHAIPTLAGVKFQSSHLMDAMMVNTMHNGVFQVMLACDEVYLGAMAMGIDWAVGSAYNFMPNVVHRMVEAFNRCDIEAARVEQARVQKVINIRNHYSHDIGTFKEIMSMSGLDLGPARLPLQPFTESERHKLHDELVTMGFFSWNNETPSTPVHRPKRRLHRRPLDRTTSLLTSDCDDPNPDQNMHRTGSMGDKRMGSLGSEHDGQVQSQVQGQSHHKLLEKRQSSTTILLTE